MVEGDWLVGFGIATFTFLIFWKFRSRFLYFEKQRVPYVKPFLIFGSDPKTIFGKNGIGQCFTQMYGALKGEKIGGFFLGWTPHWMVRDPDYVNRVFVTNFDNFPDRGFMVDEKVNPLEAHIFFLKGKKWRYLRNKLSPIFTAGKLKYMYDQMYQCSETLVECFAEQADGRDVDLKEVYARFSTDVIGSTAFGLTPHCQKDPNSKFRAMGIKFFDLGLKNKFIFACRFAFPKLLILFKIRTTDKEINDYFLGLIRQVLKVRRETGSTRNDFIELAMQTQKGTVQLDSEDEKEESYAAVESPSKSFEFTDDLLAAQSFVFFLAGFETTSTTFYFLTYMLATHKDVQDKIRAQVREVKQKYGGFTYDSLKNLTLMDNAIAETLRLFPPVPWIIRECRKSFTFPNGVTIPKGDRVAISAFAIQRDKNYFPDPELFKPERFESPPLRGTYMPFGDGPRICIGKRFAQVEMKMTLSKLLDRFTFEPSPNDNGVIEFAPGLTLVSKNPLLLRIKKNSSL